MNKKTTPPPLCYCSTALGPEQCTLHLQVRPEVRGWELEVKEAVWNQTHTNGSINIKLLKSEECVYTTGSEIPHN